MIPRFEPEEDDLFILAPSILQFEALELGLLEGKSVGTSAELDLLFLDLDKTIQAKIRPKQFSTERKKGVQIGRRVLEDVQKRVERELLSIMLRHDAGQYSSYEAFREDAIKLMKPAWKQVFEAGVRSTGIRRGARKSGPLVKLSADDQKWLRSAMTHEMRFLNGFMRAVDE